MAGISSNLNAASDLDWLTDLSKDFGDLSPAETSDVPAAKLPLDTFEKSGLDAAVARLTRTSFVGSHDLEGDDEHAYFSRAKLGEYSRFLEDCIVAAQLNASFIPSDQLRAWAKALATVAVEPGLASKTYEISRETGLPSNNLWNDVEASRLLAGSGTTFRATMRTAAASLGQLPDLKLGKIEARVVGYQGGKAIFEVTKNAYVYPGYLARTTLTLRQGDDDLITQNNGTWRVGARLHEAMQVGEGESLAALALIAKKYAGDRLLSAKQGLIGPFFFDDMIVPDDVAAILDEAPGSSLATFTEFELKPNDGQSRSTWLDRNDDFLLTALSQDWSANVSKTWVCTPDIAPALTRFAAERDPTLIVRAMI